MCLRDWSSALRGSSLAHNYFTSPQIITTPLLFQPKPHAYALMVMLLHRLYPTLIIIHLDVNPLAPTAPILSFFSNDYSSVPFMAGFRTPDSLIASRMSFVPSRCYSTSPDHPHLYADMPTHSTLHVVPIVGCSGTLAYCVHVLLFVHALTTEACEYCFQYNDLVLKTTTHSFGLRPSLRPNRTSALRILS